MAITLISIVGGIIFGFSPLPNNKIIKMILVTIAGGRI